MHSHISHVINVEIGRDPDLRTGAGGWVGGGLLSSGSSATIQIFSWDLATLLRLCAYHRLCTGGHATSQAQCFQEASLNTECSERPQEAHRAGDRLVTEWTGCCDKAKALSWWNFILCRRWIHHQWPSHVLHCYNNGSSLRSSLILLARTCLVGKLGTRRLFSWVVCRLFIIFHIWLFSSAIFIKLQQNSRWQKILRADESD